MPKNLRDGGPRQAGELPRHRPGVSLLLGAGEFAPHELDASELRALTQEYGKLRAGFTAYRERDGRILYLSDETGESTYDRPVDLCGTFGCILLVMRPASSLARPCRH